ncbi:choline/carnitine O-acyltransferase [Reinekea thalattae]|uniref:Choline/carnitine O-acyltransferase n=2 Tax=Reinekea thalattae TaxID=2593301 RepID=A0A5C8ZCK0_9GAMM|nr:choline/carnitine O-acyltransferase [Reinekea thalattae]
MAVPSLKSSCQKLLDWSKPLQTKQQQNKSKVIIDQFLQPKGEGERLQNALIDWNQTQVNSSWPAAVWQDLYLESRDSVVINSNVFYSLKSKLDRQVCSQAHIGAALIASVYGFIALIDQEKLSVDQQKGAPLCMNQYKNLFSSIRIPQPQTDVFKVSANRQHIVVLYNQCIFKLNVLQQDATPRSPKAIECDLDFILSHQQSGQNLGILTSLPRSEWSEKRQDLLALSEKNQQAMAIIEQAAFVLCLDQQSPEETVELSKQLLHGSGCDRFFDKSLQFVVFKNGKTGINFEHTGVDGSVMLRLNAHIYDTIDSVSFVVDSTVVTESNVGPLARADVSVKEVLFELNSDLHQLLDSAAQRFIAHIHNTETRFLDFLPFGKAQIKQFGVSPDSFVQLALQLAEHKLFGKCLSAYEAVMTRAFLGGRIDVLYTVSPQSIAFIEAFRSKSRSKEEKINALICASKKHIERANECRTGEGIYTHLLALKYCYKIKAKQLAIDALPELFSDSAYQLLTQSVVCTSTTSEYGVDLAGYGPIVDDGFGIRYFTKQDSIRFNMTSRMKMKDQLAKMQHYIEESLLEMAELMKSQTDLVAE